MPEKIAASFQIPYFQIMDETGAIDKNLMPVVDKDAINAMYRVMVLARVLDETMLKLQREGRCGVYAPLRGQEASQVGASSVLLKDDWLFPIYRDAAAMLLKGMPAKLIIQYFKGDERGMNIPKGVNIFPFAIPVSTQNPHAVGAAMAAKMRGDKTVVMVFLGDGASSKGDFYEAMNFAGVFKAPVVFVCENNQYAISVPRSQQTAAETIAQKAIACGFPGVQVDGNDIFAVYKAASDAVARARQGNGPSLIECMTYRLADHTTADDATKYRNDAEVKAWEKKDPILRMERYMLANSLMHEGEFQAIREEARKDVDKAVSEAEAEPRQRPEDIFNYIYAEMPQNLKEQMEYMKSFGEKK
ncbi:MAG: pyruvate dehydrogenase (acetyl-transferring) E1 component subunit alpha [Candidatus Aenigmarchaeota archaeon]|nr:pyruvate dehydrogenase (acetyl-transferring) E1 component subunit alpha [Candidatus Aenigmarchaeota archaeon]